MNYPPKRNSHDEKIDESVRGWEEKPTGLPANGLEI